VKVEYPNALRFILQDDIYLLKDDRSSYRDLQVPQPEIETAKLVFNYLGANKKRFLILVHYADHDLMFDEHLAALESVLGRKNHGRDDVAILNMAKHAVSYAALADYFDPQKVLILGQDAAPADMDRPEFNQVVKMGAVTLLYTFGFEEMMTNTENKKAFWEQVKQL
jgi:hypothetical protein